MSKDRVEIEGKLDIEYGCDGDVYYRINKKEDLAAVLNNLDGKWIRITVEEIPAGKEIEEEPRITSEGLMDPVLKEYYSQQIIDIVKGRA